jgi:TonB-like protein
MDRRHLSVTRTGLLTRSLVTSEKGESTMTVKQFWRPLVIASLMASIGLLAAPVGPSVTWAASATATSEPPPLTVQTPTTLDSYLANVEDVLNVEAMKVHTAGVADVKLTIGKDGSVQKTEIERLEGPAALRDQITSMMSQMKFAPLPADAKADVLVVDATVAFNYPGTGMLDRFGRLSRSR